MEVEVAIFFRDELRQARAKVHDDAEAFDQIIYVVENLGRHLAGQGFGLWHYAEVICGLANNSPLAEDIPNDDLRHLLVPFSTLYNMVRESRNTAMHEGVFARHLADHAVEMAIVLEHSLMNTYDQVSDYMVRNPICAELWQPLAVIRQSMLKSSFSYLPVRVEVAGNRVWRLVSDFAVALYLRDAPNKTDLHQRLRQPLSSALNSHHFTLTEPFVCEPQMSTKDALRQSNGLPVLVQDPTGHLLGILTSFDLL